MDAKVTPLSVELLQQMGEHDRLINTRRMSGPGYVWLIDGAPLVAAGLGRVTAREYFAWCVIRPQVRQSKLLMRRLTREVRRLYPLVRDAIGAEIVQADVRDDPVAFGWLEAMGLRRMPVARYAWARRQG